MGRRTIPRGFTRELAPEGVHLAVLVQFIELGTQPNSNPEWADSRKCQLAFECTDLKTKDKKPIVEYKQYTYSSSPTGSLMKDLASWLNVKDGNYDMTEALGKPAMITITHKTTEKGTFSNITNISGLPKGVKVKKPTEPLRALFLDEDFDAELFKQLPQHIQTKIADSPEYQDLIMARSGVKNSRAPIEVNGQSKNVRNNVATTIEEKPKRGRKPKSQIPEEIRRKEIVQPTKTYRR